MTARHISAEAFEREIVPSERPTLVDFYADWCGPCRAMESVVNELATEFHGQANVVKVNVDESPQLAAQYGVQAIPTFVVLRQGVPTERFVGVQSKQTLATAVAS